MPFSLTLPFSSSCLNGFPISTYQQAGENVYESEDYDQYYLDAKHKILGNGTHVILAGALQPLKLYWLETKEGLGIWYRSKERLEGVYPYGGPITFRNWYGKEVKCPRC